jgi:hypothetical protein
VSGTLENADAHFRILWDYVGDWDGRGGLLAEGYAKGYNYAANITIPPASAGNHCIIVKDGISGDERYATLIVHPEINVSPDTTVSGANVTVTGTLINNEMITLLFYDPSSRNGTAVSHILTDNTGKFTATFTMPKAEEGSYWIQAYWKDMLQAERSVTVRYNVTVSVDVAQIGTNVTVSGRLAANERFTLALTNSTWQMDFTQIDTDMDGCFQKEITVPNVSPGIYTILAYNDWLRVGADFRISQSA